MKKLFYSLLVLFSVMCLFSPSVYADGEKEQTIMIYMIGADLESQNGMASMDIDEMLDADIDTNTTNILLYTGGASRWKNDLISAEHNSLFEIGQDDLICIAATDASDNMGDPATLTDFLNYAKNAYPAERYSLILWDHGGGPLMGVGVDERNNGDGLGMGELQAALFDSGFFAENRLEMIGFDACLMGSIEVAYLLQPFAHYMVASEETEGGTGWNYAFLSEVTHHPDNGNMIGDAIIQSYSDFYDQNTYGGRMVDATLACLDLDCVMEVEEKLDALFATAIVNLNDTTYASVAQERKMSKAFGKTGVSSEDAYYDLVDLADLIYHMKMDYPDAVQDVLVALDKMILNSYSNVENVYGVSIYYPYENKSIAEMAVDVYGQMEFCSSYSNYIKEFVTLLMSPSKSIWDTTRMSLTYSVEGQSVQMGFQLPSELVDEYDHAECYILADTNEYLGIQDAYKNEKSILYHSVNVEMDDSGYIYTDYDGMCFATRGTEAYSGKTAIDWIRAEYIGEDQGNPLYRVRAILAPDQGDEDFFSTILNSEVYELFFTEDKHTGRIELLGGVLVNDNAEESDVFFTMAPKGIRSMESLIQEFDTIEFAGNPSKEMEYDENGSILPVEQWIPSHRIVTGEVLEIEDFCIIKDKLDQLSSIFCLYQITDVHQNVFMSDIVDVPANFVKTDEEMLASELDYHELADIYFGVKENPVLKSEENEQEEFWVLKFDNSLLGLSDDETMITRIKPIENAEIRYANTGYLNCGIPDDEYMYIDFSYDIDWSSEADRTIAETVGDKKLRANGHRDNSSIYNETDIREMEINGIRYAYWGCTNKGGLSEETPRGYYHIYTYATSKEGENQSIILETHIWGSYRTDADDFELERDIDDKVAWSMSHIIETGGSENES